MPVQLLNPVRLIFLSGDGRHPYQDRENIALFSGSSRHLNKKAASLPVYGVTTTLQFCR
jgi:hypothetical protein